MRFTLFRGKPQFLHKHPPALRRSAGCGLVHPNFSAPYKFNVRIESPPEFMPGGPFPKNQLMETSLYFKNNYLAVGSPMSC